MIVFKESEMKVGVCNIPYCRKDVEFWIGEEKSTFGSGFMICKQCASELHESMLAYYGKPVEMEKIAENPIEAENPVEDVASIEENTNLVIEVAVPVKPPRKKPVRSRSTKK
jgi:hypothetical protein